MRLGIVYQWIEESLEIAALPAQWVFGENRAETGVPTRGVDGVLSTDFSQNLLLNLVHFVLDLIGLDLRDQEIETIHQAQLGKV